MAALISLAPAQPDQGRDLSDAAWDEAFLRVESYLRAHRLEGRERLTRLAGILVDRARREIRPDETPVAAAMRLTDQHIQAWIDRFLNTPDEPGELARRRLRLALEIADAPVRWPHDFLADTEPPADLREAVEAAFIETGPELQFSNMAPRHIDLGPVANLAGETWETVRRRPRLRLLLFILLLVGTAAFITFQLRS